MTISYKEKMLNLIDKKNGVLRLLKEREIRHSIRVANYGQRFGEVLGLQGAELKLLYQLCLNHDIGKGRIPEKILDKKGKLTKLEDNIMKQHSIYSEEILLTISELKSHAFIVRSHHEKWDGTGYPDGLKSERIPYLSRIIALVDVYDALTSDRPYRQSHFSKKEAIQMITSGLGTHFDPGLGIKFIENIHYICELEDGRLDMLY